MTHPWTRPTTSWPALTDELVVALLRLPADRTLDLLTAGPAVGVGWLLPDRVLLAFHHAQAAHLDALAARGWTREQTCVDGHDPASTARAGAVEAVTVMRDVVRVRADAVELWWPGTVAPDLPLPALSAAPLAAWTPSREARSDAEPWW